MDGWLGMGSSKKKTNTKQELLHNKGTEGDISI
jgi:hypothetical protein